VVLASCGGNVSRSEPYVPDRLVSFGDELSLIEETSANDHNGRKYTVNAVDSTNTAVLACSSNPIWSQYVAAGYGFKYAQCNPNNEVPKAVSYAELNATVDMVATQVATYNVGFNNQTLVTLMIGTRDVLDAYESVKSGTPLADALALMEAKGTQVGALITQLVNNGAGARVLFALVPDVSYSPYAVSEEALVAGRQAMLRSLVKKFNDTAMLKMPGNGRWAALVGTENPVASYAEQFFKGVTNGYTDVTHAGCTVALPGCTTATLDTSSSTSPVFLWADSTHIAASVHSTIGAAAFNRAQNNPF